MRPFLTVSQSDYLIQIADINSHTEWQTVLIQISWLLKPTDLDLYCFEEANWSGFTLFAKAYPGSAGQGLTLFKRENKTCYFMWFVCCANDSHKMSELIFSEKILKKKKKKIKLSSATVIISIFRVKTWFWKANVSDSLWNLENQSRDKVQLDFWHRYEDRSRKNPPNMALFLLWPKSFP